MHLVKRDMKELREQSEALINGDWLKMSNAQQGRLIQSFCSGYMLPALDVVNPTTYRAQVNSDCQLFSHVRRLLAPPPEVVKTAGRLNRAGEATLYLAGTAFSAVAETRAPFGSMVSVLACRLRPDAPPLCLAPIAMTRAVGSRRIGDLSSLHKSGPLGQEFFASELRKQDCLDQWMLQDETLGHILITDMDDANQQELYELTNGIRDHLYGSWSGYNGIYYPSIMVARSSPNIALDESRWDDIQPLEVWVLEVNKELRNLPSGMFMMTKPLLNFGVVEEDGQITYKKTEKTLLTAFHDFKQKYGLIPRRDGMKQLLTKPFFRHRVSYGANPNRRVFDFYPS